MTSIDDMINALREKGFTEEQIAGLVERMDPTKRIEEWKKEFREQATEYVIVGGICLVALGIGILIVKYLWNRIDTGTGTRPAPVYVPNVQTPIGSTHELVTATAQVPGTPASTGLITTTPPQ